MKFDFLQVGLGLVGSFFTLQLISNKKSFVVFDKGNLTSLAAGGIVNTILLDKCKLIADYQVLQDVLQQNRKLALDFLKKDFYVSIPLYKCLEDDNQINFWLEKSKDLGNFVSNKLFSSSEIENNLFKNQTTLGKVTNAGRWLVEELLEDIRSELLHISVLKNEPFLYENLFYEDGFWHYGEIKAKNVVFAEGYNVLQNPFFSYLPIHLMKGYALLSKREDNRVQHIYKSKNFLLPLSDSKIYYGGNHQRNSNNFAIDNSLVEELKQELDSFQLDTDEYEARVGLRPCVKDFKPVFGEHPLHNNLFILNGVAGRGVLYGSFGAKKLFDWVYKKIPIPSQYNVNRFNRKYF